MDATTIKIDEQATEPAQKRRYGRAGVVAGLGAAVATAAIAGAADLAEVSLEIDGEAIPVLGFAQITFVAALVGIGLAAAFTRWTRRPRRTFVATTIGLTALSMVPPLMVSADTATKLVLEFAHIIAAVIVIPVIASRVAERQS